jgi:hypothetical protein
LLFFFGFTNGGASGCPFVLIYLFIPRTKASAVNTYSFLVHLKTSQDPWRWLHYSSARYFASDNVWAMFSLVQTVDAAGQDASVWVRTLLKGFAVAPQH